MFAFVIRIVVWSCLCVGPTRSCLLHGFIIVHGVIGALLIRSCGFGVIGVLLIRSCDFPGFRSCAFDGLIVILTVHERVIVCVVVSRIFIRVHFFILGHDILA